MTRQISENLDTDVKIREIANACKHVRVYEVATDFPQWCNKDTDVKTDVKIREIAYACEHERVCEVATDFPLWCNKFFVQEFWHTSSPAQLGDETAIHCRQGNIVEIDDANLQIKMGPNKWENCMEKIENLRILWHLSQ
jgi:hypothetical protein